MREKKQKGWEIKREAYWNLEEIPPIDGNPMSIIRDELDAISKIIIRSDVPVGIALSGGIDSGILAILAKRYYTKDLHAFTMGYEGNF